MENGSAVFDAGRIRHDDVSYESRDLSHRAVFVFLFTLGMGLLVIQIAIWGVFRNLGGSQYAGHQTTNPIMTSNEQLKEVGGDPALSFPVPRLQPNDIADLNKFRVDEEEQLNSYGWVDRNQDRIRIPIERAIDMMGSTWPQQQERTAMGAEGESAHADERRMQTAMKDEREGNYGW